MEYNDIYDKDRNLTGRVHRRGTPWKKGEYGLVVCVWVYDGKGKLLLTRRAPEKSYPGTWENSGGAAKAGETSLEAIARELAEETGIHGKPEEFEHIGSGRDRYNHYDYYCIRKEVPIEEVVLLPGETDDAAWLTFEEVHKLVKEKKICKIISSQFLKQEPELLKRID